VDLIFITVAGSRLGQHHFRAQSENSHPNILVTGALGTMLCPRLSGVD
jgi:hypothetical protein